MPHHQPQRSPPPACFPATRDGTGFAVAEGCDSEREDDLQSIDGGGGADSTPELPRMLLPSSAAAAAETAIGVASLASSTLILSSSRRGPPPPPGGSSGSAALSLSSRSLRAATNLVGPLLRLDTSGVGIGDEESLISALLTAAPVIVPPGSMFASAIAFTNAMSADPLGSAEASRAEAPTGLGSAASVGKSTASLLHRGATATVELVRVNTSSASPVPPPLLGRSGDADYAPDRTALVAVKTIDLRDDFRRDAALAELAFAERGAQRLAAIGCRELSPWRGIAQVYGARIDTDGARCTVACEALTGGTLADASAVVPASAVVESDGFDVCEAHPANRGEFRAALRVVARDVLLGLHTLHTTFRAVHNDLKLDNVMLVRPLNAGGHGDDDCTCLNGLRGVRQSKDGARRPSPCPHASHAKIIDFGCVALLPLATTSPGDDDAADGGRATFALPQRGALSTMAPERLRGDAYGPTADVWALGVMLLQLARGGRHPFLDPPSEDVATPADAAEVTDTFWRLAAVLDPLNGTHGCERATGAAVAAALNDSVLGRSDAGFAAFVHRALRADAAQRAGVAELLADSWLRD